jgi:hypothetical protein
MNNEPVAWMSSQTDEDGDKLTMLSTYNDPLNTKQIPLYIHPAKTLTDEEIEELAEYHGIDSLYETGRLDFARAILRKAQEK